ncbi:MAG: GTPase HflX [Sphaerochaeta sp.]|jgi:GTP-binding protein HflX|nr:GTPase HflX [Sphaerochaeta sp.]
MYETKEAPAKALLFSLKEDGSDPLMEALNREELESLVSTLGDEVLSSEEIPVRTISPATYIGSGKVQEIKEEIQENDANLVVFNMILSPRVQRNLEKAWETPVIDREEVILRIFAQRARTKEAKLQVELASLQYQRPRLRRMWTGLNRQHGGFYGTKGEGETQLELDQRIIDDKIVQLKKDLAKVSKDREMQRQSRMRSPLPRCAIVGYTNSGKSSLLNLLAPDAGVLVEDKLFATLDPTTRMVKLPGGEEMLLSDTVGFVSNLPTHLVEAFKSTLEEAKYADFLIIVCDASHPDMLSCWNTTKTVLEELSCADKPAIVFINKMDKPFDMFAVNRLKTLSPIVVTGSVTEKSNIDVLDDVILDMIHRLSPVMDLTIPEDRYDLVARIRREGQIITIDYSGEGVHLTARVQNPSLRDLLEPFLAFAKA